MLAFALCAAPAAGAEPLAVDSAPVPLMAGAPAEERLGGLAWRGGLHLLSDDLRFGGVSGLAVAADGAAFAAITDAGHWITGALVWEGGRLAAVAALEVAPLRDAAGAPLAGKADSDAEALARSPDGSYIVAFERRHRLLAYSRPGGPGAPVFPGLDLAGLPPNGGVEALAFMPGGALLALAEGAAGDNRRAAWRLAGRRAAPFAWPADPFFRPTAAAPLPGGEVLVLERGYSRARGVEARLMRAAPPAPPREVARLAPPATVDNFEALAAFRAAGGETVLLIASDDNFNPAQRTLLLAFALVE